MPWLFQPVRVSPLVGVRVSPLVGGRVRPPPMMRLHPLVWLRVRVPPPLLWVSRLVRMARLIRVSRLVLVRVPVLLWVPVLLLELSTTMLLSVPVPVLPLVWPVEVVRAYLDVEVLQAVALGWRFLGTSRSIQHRAAPFR